MRLLLIIFLLYTIMLNPVHAKEKRPSLNVTFLVPAEKNNPFWQLVENNMKVAAQQFNINLNIIHIKKKTDVNRYHHLELSQSILQKSPRIDYFITAFHDGKTIELLELIEDKQIKYLSLINNVTENTLKRSGLPREKYSHWIGEIASDGEHAGHTLAQRLIDTAEHRLHFNKGIIAISGARDHVTVKLRERGLKNRLTKTSLYPLKQLVYSQWQPDLIQQQTEALLSRHKDAGIIWCANDDVITSNVIKTLNKFKIRPNKDILIGGINWSKQGIKQFKSGQLTTSLGGHFLDGGIALALLYDHYHGYDFYQQYKGSVKQKMLNINDYLNQAERLVINNEWDQLDFTVYSKALNPEHKQWDYGYSKVLDTMN